MIMLNSKMQTNLFGYNSTTQLFSAIKLDLQNSLNELYFIQNEINLSQLDVSAEHMNLLDGKSIDLFFR